MPIMLADYRSMCDLFGPLDFETFCAGYAFFEEWKAAPIEARTLPLMS